MRKADKRALCHVTSHHTTSQHTFDRSVVSSHSIPVLKLYEKLFCAPKPSACFFRFANCRARAACASHARSIPPPLPSGSFSLPASSASRSRKPLRASHCPRWALNSPVRDTKTALRYSVARLVAVLGLCHLIIWAYRKEVTDWLCEHRSSQSTRQYSARRGTRKPAHRSPTHRHQANG